MGTVLWELASKISKGRWSDARAVTPQRVQHVFDWAAATNVLGWGKQAPGRLGGSLSVEREAKTIHHRRDNTWFRAGETTEEPAHLCWYHNPYFAYVCLIDGRVELRSTTKGAPVQRAGRANAVQAARIAGYFEDWYAHLGLPDSICDHLDTSAQAAARLAAEVAAGGGRLGSVRRYLEGTLDLDTMSELGNIVILVDWRSSDDDIVAMCEGLLETGRLSAAFVPNDASADLVITYGRRRATVPYPQPEADRDTTLLTLNQVLAPGYELRFVTQSAGSDTLAFLPLATTEWQALERDHGAAVAERFAPLAPGVRLFG